MGEGEREKKIEGRKEICCYISMGASRVMRPCVLLIVLNVCTVHMIALQQFGPEKVIIAANEGLLL